MTLTLEHAQSEHGWPRRAIPTVESNNMQEHVELGAERLLEGAHSVPQGARVGLICNQASVDHRYRHAADLLHEHSDIQLRALVGPQHGIRGDVQDNMVETGHSVDRMTGLPVHSLC